MRLLLVSDAAFDTSGKEKSQHGWLAAVTTPQLNEGEEAPVSLLQWRSRRLRRKAASTTLCEAIAASTALASLEKIQAYMESIRFADFSPKKYQRVEDDTELRGQSTVIAADSGKYMDPECILVVDAKAVYDALCSETCSGDCERSQLEYAVIRESTTLLNARPRWVPHNRNPSDLLTKWKGARAEPMMALLSTARFKVVPETEELAKGRQSDCRKKSLATKC